MADTSSLASLLSGLFSGAAGIQELTSNTTANAAATASPFQSQYVTYQGQVQNALNSVTANQQGANASIGSEVSQLNDLASSGNSNLGNILNAMGGIRSGTAQNLADTNAGSTTAAEQASGGNLETQLSNLSSNYMSNPAIQSMLQTGMQTVNRGLAAQGLSGSGAQQAELQAYGQNFAAQEYNQQFANLISGSNAVQAQNMGVTQENAALQGQTFNQTLSADTLQSEQLSGMANTANSMFTNQEGALTAAGSLATNNSNLLLNSSQGLLTSLEALSGATTGSPATAGSILSQQFGNTETGIGNLGAGAVGSLTGLSSLLSGSNGSGLSSLLSGLSNNSSVSSLLSGLLGSDATGTFSSDTLAGLESSLGSSTSGGFEALLGGGTDSVASQGLSALLGL